jgi:Caspase domain
MDSSSGMKPSLYALLIGINAYDPKLAIDGQYAFGPLQGCVADTQALHDWLAQDGAFALKPKLLFNEAATKANIVAAFKEHLSQAQAGDAILVFYSGHGSVEVADMEVWSTERDGRLEGLACYYEQGDSGKFLLADKELRYLLHEISKPDVHVVTLFDCCHAGDNTRNAIETDVQKKQAFVTFKQRRWEDFVFSEKYEREAFIREGAEKLLPEGQYIQLAAAESNEAAEEALINRERHGVFAWFMLDILRETGGHISYRDLCNRMRNRIRYKYGQRIKIYAPPAVRALENSGFLQKEVPTAQTGYGTVDFNTEYLEYRLDKGILDRVASQRTTVLATDIDGSIYTGRVGRTELGSAEVVFDGATSSKLSKKPMRAVLENLASRPLRMLFENKDLSPQQAEALSTAIFTLENENFVQQESELSRADYCLVSAAGMYYLCKPGNWFRPVVMPVFQNDGNAADSLLAQIKHIAQWHFMLDLQNDTDTKIPPDLLQIDITDAAGITLPLKDGVVAVSLKKNGDQYDAPISIRLTNNATKDLYVQPVLMMDFGCWLSIISNPDGSRAIEPGNFESLEVNKSKVISLGLDDSARLFNHESSSSILKFIISLAPINGTEKLELPALPMPEHLRKRSSSRGSTSKGNFGVSTQTMALPDDGWNTRNIVVQTHNPLFNTLDPNGVAALLSENVGNNDLMYFLEGIYGIT